MSSESDLGSSESESSLVICKYLRSANSTESVCGIMFETSPTNDEELENTQIIIRILGYLNHKELRDARLLSLAFNKIITEEGLLWTKCVFRIHIQSYDNEKQTKKEWAQLRLNKLITDYNCPNFHFLKTNLQEPWAVEFFQASVRHQIKHLKITKCVLTVDTLFHILAYCGRSLEHLEIVNISKSRNSSTEGRLPTLNSFQHIYLPTLLTLILNRKCEKDRMLDINEDKPRSSEWSEFLRVTLEGSRNLEKICLLGWSAKTCSRMTRLLNAHYPEKLQNLETLEISCQIEEDLGQSQQYTWLKSFGWIHLPNLRKLVLKFSINVESEVYSEDSTLVAASTQWVATLIEGSRDTLEFIELVNCPLSSNVFRAGIRNFPSLRYVNAKGSFIKRLDNETNPIYENSIRKGDLQRKLSMICEYDASTTDEETASTATVANRTRSQIPILEVYKIICAVIVVAAVVHNGLAWAMGPYLGKKLEIFLYAVSILYYTKGQEITEMWPSTL